MWFTETAWPPIIMLSIVAVVCVLAGCRLSGRSGSWLRGWWFCSAGQSGMSRTDRHPRRASRREPAGDDRCLPEEQRS